MEIPSKKKVLILCTGNSARSQTAEGLVNHYFAEELEAHSAGTDPQGLNHYAAHVMAELGIDISKATPKHVSNFAGQVFDYVITLCDDANTNCPIFPGAGKRLHMGFRDPARATGGEDQILAVFRDVRDEILCRISKYFRKELKPNGKKA